LPGVVKGKFLVVREAVDAAGVVMERSVKAAALAA